jgi:hypothetical protein
VIVHFPSLFDFKPSHFSELREKFQPFISKELLHFIASSTEFTVIFQLLIVKFAFEEIQFSKFAFIFRLQVQSIVKSSFENTAESDSLSSEYFFQSEIVFVVHSTKFNVTLPDFTKIAEESLFEISTQARFKTTSEFSPASTINCQFEIFQEIV